MIPKALQSQTQSQRINTITSRRILKEKDAFEKSQMRKTASHKPIIAGKSMRRYIG
jgi:hypothetical protein